MRYKLKQGEYHDLPISDALAPNHRNGRKHQLFPGANGSDRK
jgi:hypothetical protein